MIIPIVSGIIGALVMIVLGRTRGRQGEQQVYAIGLTVAALVYVGFALYHGGGAALRVELIGLAIFGLLTIIGLRLSPLVVAAGWVAHMVWDRLFTATLMRVMRPSGTRLCVLASTFLLPGM